MIDLDNKFEQILQEAQENYPVNVDAIADKLGIEVIYSDEYINDFAGLIKKKSSDDKYIIIINNKHLHNRKRFTLAHEIAHYYLHKKLIDEKAIVDDALYRSNESLQTEVEANRKAADILMPMHLINKIKREIEESKYDKIMTKDILARHEYIAKMLEVSQQALAIRLGLAYSIQ